MPTLKDLSSVRSLTAAFIDVVWNQQQLDQLDNYLHPDFVDHSLAAGLPPDRTGLQQWIQATSRAFHHQTHIEDHVTEGAKSVLRITMELTHIGEWRGIAATGRLVRTTGYRLFRVAEGKIIEHWAAIDGTQLESALRALPTPGCTAPQ